MANRETADTTDGGDGVDATSDPEPEPGPTTDAEAGDLVVVCGLPGVGKTTVAERIADRVDGGVLRTDVIRKELCPDPTYSDAETEAVYEELIDRACDRVAAGESVVLDATFADARHRAAVRGMAERTAGGFAIVKVECDEPVVKRRMERRDGISDADFGIHLRFKQLFDEVNDADVVVDNSGDQAATFTQVDEAFR